MDLPHSSVGKESACNAGDTGSIPGLGRTPGEGKAQFSQLEHLEVHSSCTVEAWLGEF